MQKALLVGLVLLLLAAGAIAWFASDGDPQLVGPNVSRSNVANATEADASAANLAAPQPSEASGQSDAAARGLVATAGEATSRPLPAEPNWIAVKIVAKATGSPVPGAIVHWFDESAQDWLQEHHRAIANELSELRWHGERFAELVGWRTRSDADGIARVTLKESTTVLARHDSAFGRLQLQGTTVTPVGGHVLELVADLVLTVRAVDDRGAPCVGVPVTIAMYDKDGTPTGWMGHESLARTRAPDGFATISHLQQLVTDAFGPFGAADPKHDWRVRLLLPGHDEPGVVFDINAPPAEAIELRVPPCGSLRVRAEFAGKPVPGFDHAWFSSTNDGNDWRPRATRRAEADVDGQVRFPWVPVGAKYRVGSSAIGGLNSEVAGPRQAGHEVEVVLAPPHDAMLLAGRLLLPNQLPLVEQRVQLRTIGMLRAQAELRTDRDGRFLVTMGSPRKDNRVDQLWFEFTKKGEPPRRADAPPRTLRPGVDELGDLVLADGAVVVAGRIVFGEQPFLDPMTLRVERFETATPSPAGERAGLEEMRERFLPDGSGGLNYGGRGDGAGPRWRRVTGMLEHKDGVGGFTIRGPATAGRYRLVASSQKALPVEPIEFALGATDVVVKVDPGQSLAASVLLPERATTENLSAVLVPATPPPAGDRQGGRLTQGFGQARGTHHNVQWLSVPAGRYTLELRLFTRPGALVSIADVVLPPPAGGDARLADIDLRSLLRVVTIDLCSADGAPLTEINGAALPGPAPAGPDWLGYACHMPSQPLLLPAGPYDLLVCVNGHRPQPARGNDDTAVVRLDPWPTVAVLVADVPPLPANARVNVSLQPAERTDLKYRTQWSSGDRNELLAPSRRNVQVVGGKALVPIGDGLFTLRVQVSGNRRSHTIEGHEPRQVLSTAGTVQVTVPPAQWQKAIEVVTPPPPK